MERAVEQGPDDLSVVATVQHFRHDGRASLSWNELTVPVERQDVAELAPPVVFGPHAYATWATTW